MPGFGREPRDLRVGELPVLRLRVTELGSNDPAGTQRLLGQLAGLEAAAANRKDDEILTFVPVRGCRELADRALANLHSPAFKSRRARPREAESPRDAD
jgi:hypothetical protein